MTPGGIRCQRSSGLIFPLPCASICSTASKERRITVEDLYKLKRWRESEPEAPEGLWYKDFDSFKICGEGKFPKTFLLKDQAAKGTAL